MNPDFLAGMLAGAFLGAALIILLIQQRVVYAAFRLTPDEWQIVADEERREQEERLETLRPLPETWPYDLPITATPSSIDWMPHFPLSNSRRADRWD